MGQPTSKPDHAFAYTPPTRQTAYGPDTNSMDWGVGSTGRREAKINTAFKHLGEKSDDALGDIRRRETLREITNQPGGAFPDLQKQLNEAISPTPGRGTVEDPIEGRGG